MTMSSTRLWLCLCLLLSMMGAAAAQIAGTRLILKDGSYQVIKKYEMKGDRVRYFSTERAEWEEIPSSLIDWPATARWNHDHTYDSGQPAINPSPGDPEQVEAAKIDAEERAERAEEAARMPTVAPGLELPDESGVWVLDIFHGHPELTHVMQANGDLNRATEHSVLPYMLDSKPGSRQLVRIDGYESKVELHIDTPVFYVSVDPPPSDRPELPPDGALTVDTHGASSAVKGKNSHSSPNSRYVIISLASNRNLRSADAVELASLTQPHPSEAVIETTSEILPGGRWMKLIPKSPLVIGEYALLEILAPRQVNLDVWDFGVNPRAKENQDARTSLIDTP
jgi:hypothetical protein